MDDIIALTNVSSDSRGDKTAHLIEILSKFKQDVDKMKTDYELKLKELDKNIVLKLETYSLSESSTGNKIDTAVIDWSARKLLMSVMLFMLDPFIYANNKIVIYGLDIDPNVIKYIRSLYKRHSILLINKNQKETSVIKPVKIDANWKFNSTTSVDLYTGELTDDVLKMLSLFNPMFICDEIQSQIEIVGKLNPKVSLLKFDGKTDRFLGDDEPLIYKQIWTSASNIETRVVVNRENNHITREYPLQLYLDQMYYHNKWSRTHQYPQPCISDELNNKFDACGETIILYKYIQMMANEEKEFQSEVFLIINKTHTICSKIDRFSKHISNALSSEFTLKTWFKQHTK